MKRPPKTRTTKIYRRGKMRGEIVETAQPEPSKPKKTKGEERSTMGASE